MVREREGGREGKKDREKREREGHGGGEGERERGKHIHYYLLCCKECFHNFYFVLLFGSALLVIGCLMCDIRCV